MIPVDNSLVRVVDEGVYAFYLESNSDNVVVYGDADDGQFECEVLQPYPYNDVQTVFLEKKQGLWQTIKNAIWNG